MSSPTNPPSDDPTLRNTTSQKLPPCLNQSGASTVDAKTQSLESLCFNRLLLLHHHHHHRHMMIRICEVEDMKSRLRDLLTRPCWCPLPSFHSHHLTSSPTFTQPMLFKPSNLVFSSIFSP
ncbi:hypothetical protein KC19_12G085900 [Ceratodon purpureus]|uniref:Uncharacterized protein n=1 Tax=Ceratodon purpureus TaxID=3225 RepID=A0A8T0G5M9_CERPU|nr:hypothetical protein KC19_12G085900 [Ceratodon purpureus]